MVNWTFIPVFLGEVAPRGPNLGLLFEDIHLRYKAMRSVCSVCWGNARGGTIRTTARKQTSKKTVFAQKIDFADALAQ